MEKLKVSTIFIRAQSENKILNKMEPVVLFEMRIYRDPKDSSSEYYSVKKMMSAYLSWQEMLRFVRFTKDQFLMDVAKEFVNKLC